VKRFILLTMCAWPVAAGAQSASDLATFNAKTAPLIALVQQADRVTAPVDNNNSAIFTIDMHPWLKALYEARIAKDCGFRGSDWYNSIDKFVLNQVHIVVNNLWGGAPTPYPAAAEHQFVKEMGQSEGAADNAVPAACASGMDAAVVNQLDALINRPGGGGDVISPPFFVRSHSG
jgi:hypothetical protein